MKNLHINLTYGSKLRVCSTDCKCGDVVYGTSALMSARILRHFWKLHATVSLLLLLTLTLHDIKKKTVKICKCQGNIFRSSGRKSCLHLTTTWRGGAGGTVFYIYTCTAPSFIKARSHIRIPPLQRCQK